MSDEAAGYLADCGPCPYLPDRRFQAVVAELPELGDDPTAAYRGLMDQGFRRNAGMVYRPLCPGCQACQPIRVDVARFAERKDQRRCRKRNADLSIHQAEPGFDAERRALYDRYQQGVHGDPPLLADDDGRFLVDGGGVTGIELHARDSDGRLIGVSSCDCFDDALSSMYCYYDPDQPRRSLGTWLALAEIDWCRANGKRWLYLGFYVEGCAKMMYKNRFRPCELLTRGVWQPASDAADAE